VPIRPAMNGSSATVIEPSWFALHRLFMPSPVAPLSPPTAPSTAAGPQVPSALQNPDAQSVSCVQVSPEGPPQPAPNGTHMLQSNMNASQARISMGARYVRGLSVSSVFLQCSKEPACTAANELLRCGRGDGPDQEVRQPAALRHGR